MSILMFLPPRGVSSILPSEVRHSFISSACSSLLRPGTAGSNPCQLRFLMNWVFSTFIFSRYPNTKHSGEEVYGLSSISDRGNTPVKSLVPLWDRAEEARRSCEVHGPQHRARTCYVAAFLCTMRTLCDPPHPGHVEKKLV